jgi:hypothetical protein
MADLRIHNRERAYEDAENSGLAAETWSEVPTLIYPPGFNPGSHFPTPEQTKSGAERDLTRVLDELWDDLRNKADRGEPQRSPDTHSSPPRVEGRSTATGTTPPLATDVPARRATTWSPLSALIAGLLCAALFALAALLAVAGYLACLGAVELSLDSVLATLPKAWEVLGEWQAAVALAAFLAWLAFSKALVRAFWR